MGLTKQQFEGRRPFMELGPQTVTVCLFSEDQAGAGAATVTGSVFWIAPVYLDLKWRVASIEFVQDGAADADTSVKISRYDKNLGSGSLLATFDVSSLTSQNMLEADLSGLSETDLTLEPGDKLVVDTVGSPNNMRGVAVTVAVVPEKSTWFRFEPEI